MKTTAHICLKNESAEFRFEWCGFDGDDCFNDFHINVRAPSVTRRFDFGPCAVNGLGKVRAFVRDETKSAVDRGFRSPDVRSYELRRERDQYHLVVRFEESGLSEQFDILNPTVEMDDEFMRTVYSD